MAKRRSIKIDTVRSSKSSSTRSDAGGGLHGSNPHARAAQHHRKPDVIKSRRKKAAKGIVAGATLAPTPVGAATRAAVVGVRTVKGARAGQRALRAKGATDTSKDLFKDMDKWIEGAKGAGGKKLPLPRKPSVTARPTPRPRVQKARTMEEAIETAKAGAKQMKKEKWERRKEVHEDPAVKLAGAAVVGEAYNYKNTVGRARAKKRGKK